MTKADLKKIKENFPEIDEEKLAKLFNLSDNDELKNELFGLQRRSVYIIGAEINRIKDRQLPLLTKELNYSFDDWCEVRLVYGQRQKCFRPLSIRVDGVTWIPVDTLSKKMKKDLLESNRIHIEYRILVEQRNLKRFKEELKTTNDRIREIKKVLNEREHNKSIKTV